MLTLGKDGTRTDCKADNHRDHLIQRTASSCQLAQKRVLETWAKKPLMHIGTLQCTESYDSRNAYSVPSDTGSRGPMNPRILYHFWILTGLLMAVNSGSKFPWVWRICQGTCHGRSVPGVPDLEYARYFENAG